MQPAIPQAPQGSPILNLLHQQSALALHPEIQSVVQLYKAHAHKVYFSGCLLCRLPDGSRRKRDKGWTDIWAQLNGTTLSVWDMNPEASNQGRKVPPSCINVADAVIRVLGSVTAPTTKRYPDLLVSNNADANLYFFSCPNTPALISWAAALQLAVWEKTRLDEIYTAHLIRITFRAADIPTTLVKGRMEGWAKIRVAGQTGWKRLWVVVQKGTDDQQASSLNSAIRSSTKLVKKQHLSNLFSPKGSDLRSLFLPKPIISMFISPKQKDRKKPVLTISAITQAFSVCPDPPELINNSALIKVEGTFGVENMAQPLQSQDAHLMFIPETESADERLDEMLKWVVAIHDAFGLYGRPDAWNWNTMDPNSLMYGYPVGPQKERLFLERDVVEGIDPRDRTSIIRVEMKKLLQQRVREVASNKASPQSASARDTVALLPMNGSNITGSTRSSPNIQVTERLSASPDSLYDFKIVVFQVGNTLFRVARNWFEVPGTPFEAMFSLPTGEVSSDQLEGSCDKNPIVLPVDEKSFKGFLGAMFSIRNHTMKDKDWLGALDLATMWTFSDIREKAIQNLDFYIQNRTAKEAVLLAKKYKVASWLKDSYNRLLQQHTLTMEELTTEPTLDLETISKLFCIKKANAFIRCPISGYCAGCGKYNVLTGLHNPNNQPDFKPLLCEEFRQEFAAMD